MIAVNVEEKLFQNRYKVDHGRPHIQIKDADVCKNECVSQSCTYVCPASCYKAEGNRAGTPRPRWCARCRSPGNCRIRGSRR